MPRIGYTIGGKYVLQEEIGEGAMGSVWKAVHQTLGRPFAVKFLKALGMNADRMEKRFFQEARLAASIQHRFVVDIVDFGVTDEGTPYMVMEHLQGESLGRRLTHGPALPVRELIRILAQSLVGLEAVHQAGVIHRDLKPENVMLVPEAGGAIPKLVDFGISRSETQMSDITRSTKLTQPGLTVGTPWYMSPEQVRGRKNIDRRTDTYSMGVILYEALTGKLPFDDPDQLQLLRKVVNGGADPVMAIRPELGPYLSAIVERAMLVNPGRRFGTASEMAATLFSVTGQVPETLACPIRAQSDTETSSTIVAVQPATILPGHSELSSDLMNKAQPLFGFIEPLRGLPGRISSMRHRGLLVAAGMVVVLTAGTFMARALTRPDVPPSPAVVDTSPSAPSMVRLPTVIVGNGDARVQKKPTVRRKHAKKAKPRPRKTASAPRKPPTNSGL